MFILLTSVTLLNMLVGIMVQAVDVLSALEREQRVVNSLNEEICRFLDAHQLSEQGVLGADEFRLLISDPPAVKFLADVGVDVMALVGYMDFLFKDGKKYKSGELIDMLMELRGTNLCTVKDIVTLRRWFDTEFQATMETLET